MIEKKWYKWPQGYYEKPWKPWYGILRAVVAAPFVYSGFSILYFGIILSNGAKDAEHWREELF